MKTISVKLEVNKSTHYIDLDYDDLDLTEEKYNELPEDGKRQKVQEYVHDLQEQPYWVVDKITED